MTDDGPTVIAARSCSRSSLDVPSTFGASNAYDAAYVVAYVITAIGDAPLVGGIATGFGKTVGGAELIDVGPNPINHPTT